MNSSNKIQSSNGSLGLQKLLQEPERLVNEANRINEELESLVIENYRVFIENLTCSQHLQSEEKKLDDISTSMKQEITELSAICQSFKEKVAPFLNHHKRNRKSLQHHMQLLELLEVPQLVDACTRNGFYEEAIELANFVNSLERRHLLANEVKSAEVKTQGQDVIQNIVDEVHMILHQLNHQLLIQLSEINSLPKQIQIVSTLRKMDSIFIDRYLIKQRLVQLQPPSSSSSIISSNNNDIDDSARHIIRNEYLQLSEIKHQMDFLEAKSVWMQKIFDDSKSIDRIASSLPGAPKTPNHMAIGVIGPYGKIIELLENRRTSLFAIVTQFKALFLDTNPSNATGDSANNNSTSSSASPSMSTSKLILHTWFSKQIDGLIRELKVLLPQIDEGSSLKAILEQVHFFTNCLAPVGGDFFPLFLSLFEENLKSRFEKGINESLDHFKIILKTEKISFETNTSAEQFVPLYNPEDKLHEQFFKESTADSSVTELAIPKNLLRFPPLAYLANAFITSLIFLKECPLLTVYNSSLLTLFTWLEGILEEILSYASEIKQKGKKYLGEISSKKNKKDSIADIPLDHLYAESFAYDFVPHVLLCFEFIFDRVSPNSVLNLYQALGQRQKSESNSKVYLASEILKLSELLGKQMAHQIELFWGKLNQAKLLDISQKENLLIAAHSIHINPVVLNSQPTTIMKTKSTDETIEPQISEDLIDSVNKDE